MINNYPLTSEMASSVTPSGDARTVCYIGNIGRNRGIFEMVHALEFVDARLILAGRFDGGDLQSEVRMLPGWAKVDYRGVVSREEVYQIMAQSRAGLLFLHPEPNHVYSQPIKMFEYMSAGLPVLASNFPFWRTFIEDAATGRQVDPLDPGAIACIIRDTLDNPSSAKAMGSRGRQAVMTQYLWNSEARKLLGLYRDLLT